MYCKSTEDQRVQHTKEDLEKMKKEELKLIKDMEKIAKKLQKLKEQEDKLNAELKEITNKLTRLHVRTSDNPNPEEHEKALYDKLWQRVGFIRRKEYEGGCPVFRHN